MSPSKAPENSGRDQTNDENASRRRSPRKDFRLGFEGLGPRFRSPGFMFRVSRSGFRISGFGFQDQGFGLLGLGIRGADR